MKNNQLSLWLNLLKKSVWGVCVIAVFVTSEIFAAGNSTVVLMSELPGPPNDSVVLGTAYHSQKKGFYALQTVEGQVSEDYGNTEIDFRIGVDLGYKSLLKMTSGNLDAGVNFPTVRADAGAYIAKETASDQYTSSYTLYVTLKPKKRLLIPRASAGFQPTTAAMELAAAYPADLYDNLGDEFVTGIEYGSYVLVNIKFEYLNSKDKQKIGGHLNVDWAGTIKVGGSLDSLEQKTKESIRISVTARQEGGDQNELVQIIPDGLMECSLLHPEPCFDIFEAVVSYIKTDYILQFNSLDKYNTMQLFTDRYRTSGTGLAPLTPEYYPKQRFVSKIALKNLSDKWEAAMLDKRRAANVLAYYSGYLTAQEEQEIQDIEQKASFNTFLYADAVEYCYTKTLGDLCYQREQEAKDYAQTYDRTKLEID